ncbi:MAG: DEAD/DEAH box helicase [Bacteroidetes bacterium]|nr:DEAD/DEAH box helicase [Bacteroidota bacterium]
MEKFKALGLSENVLSALQKKGWEQPSPIQEKTIPLLLSGAKDIVGQAQTGTGKTAAFGLPLIEKLDDNSKNVQALILCPTRELAIQVAEEISSYKGDKKFSVLPVYGGQSYVIQERGLKRGSQIVVGTPGRIRDLIDKRTLKLEHVTHVVLDEADEMLNMGFEEEVREILKSVPAERRMLLFSATMPAQILRLAKNFMKDYDLVEVKKEQVTSDLTEQIYFEVRESERFEALSRIIDVEPDFYGIIFCRTKIETDQVAHKLNDRGYEAEAMHGDVSQSQRELIIKKFKAKKATILVATDVAARGIDVNDLTHVINYNLPQDPEAYVHRIGRTGRAGKQGTAITFITPHEFRELLFIQKIARATIKKENVPTVKDVVATKRKRMKADIMEMIDSGGYQEYVDMAHELIDEGQTAERVVAALLKYTFKDELKEDSYREISESRGGSVDIKGTARLFVALGREQGYNPATLTKFLEEEGTINQSAIKDIKVYDKFSFITVSFVEAEQLLAVFSKNKAGRKPLITKAKERDSGGGSGRSFGGGGGHRTNNSDERREKSFDDKPSGRGDRKPFGEKKQFSGKPDFRKPKPETAVSNVAQPTENKPARKRTNKMTDYLEKPASPENEKPGKKKNDSSVVDEFMKKFDDDLSW